MSSSPATGYPHYHHQNTPLFSSDECGYGYGYPHHEVYGQLQSLKGANIRKPVPQWGYEAHEKGKPDLQWGYEAHEKGKSGFQWGYEAHEKGKPDNRSGYESQIKGAKGSR